MKKVKLLLVLFIGLFFVITCSDDNTTEPSNPTPTKTYKIGVLIPETGAGQLNGQQSKASVEYAITDINNYFSANNIKVRLQAIYKDSGTDSVQALAMLKEFADDTVKIVVGPYSSTTLTGLKHFADSAGILLISHSAVSSALAIEGDNIFRFVPDDKWQAKAIAKIMKDDNKLVVIPLVRDDVWGRSLYSEVEKELANTSVTLQVPQYYPPSQTNFSSIVQNIRSQIDNLEATFLKSEIGVYIISYDEGTNIMKQVSYFDDVMSVKFYGSSAFAWNSTLPADIKAAEASVKTKLECPIIGFNENYKNVYSPLVERLGTKLLREPDSYALSVYDAAYVAGLTLALASDTVSIDAIKDNVRSVLKTYSGMNGPIELDKNDDRINVTYDFMSLILSENVYKWQTTAVYDTKTGVLTRK